MTALRMPWRALDTHPAAELFPMMGAGELRTLADDIAKHGQLHPVIIFENLVLDGRNRLKACELNGAKPRIKTLTSCPSPTAYVLSANQHRRQLSKSQLAMVAERSLPMFEAEAKERRRATLKQNADPERIPERDQGDARDHAAKAVGINARYVSDAKRIRTKDPETAAMVERGELTIPQARNRVADTELAPESGKLHRAQWGRTAEQGATGRSGGQLMRISASSGEMIVRSQRQQPDGTLAPDTLDRSRAARKPRHPELLRAVVLAELDGDIDLVDRLLFQLAALNTPTGGRREFR